METEAAEGAHNNQLTNGIDMAAVMVFVAAAAAREAATAAAVTAASSFLCKEKDVGSQQW